MLAWMIAGIATLYAIAFDLAAAHGRDGVRKSPQSTNCPVPENTRERCDLLMHRWNLCVQGQDLQRRAFDLVGTAGARSYVLEPAADTPLRATLLVDQGERRALVLVRASDGPKSDETVPLQVWLSRGHQAPQAAAPVDWVSPAVGISSIDPQKLDPMPDHVFVAPRGDVFDADRVLLKSALR